MTPEQRRALVEQYLQQARNTITRFNEEIRKPEVVSPTTPIGE